MTTLRTFPSVFPHTYIGYQDIFDSLKETSPTYPPHNIIKFSDGSHAIEIAVAGYDQDELDLEVEKKVLTVKNIKKDLSDERDDIVDNGDDPVYIHRGISKKNFTLKFRLADYVEIGDVRLENGILWIPLNRNVPDEAKPKKLMVNSASTKE